MVKKLLRDNWPTEKVLYNYRPDWLKNPKTGHNLELDIYYPDRNLAIEIQGIHHETTYQKYKDSIKAQVCKEKGITLESLRLKSKYLRKFIEKYNLNTKGIINPHRSGARKPRRNTWADKYLKQVKKQLRKDHYAIITDIQKKETERIRAVRTHREAMQVSHKETSVI